MHEAERMKKLPLYLFTIIDDFKAAAISKGIDLIDLGMGNPDQPSPEHVVKKLADSVGNPANHRYMRPDNPIETRLREAIAEWYKKRFGVKLDSHSEVLPLIGSKEGIVHLTLSILNPGDTVIVPAPTYPVHFNSVILAEAEPYHLRLQKADDYRMNFREISEKIARKTRLIIVSYPHNPTTGVVDLEFYEELVSWAKKYDVLIASDLAYSDIAFNGYRSPSLMQAKGAKDIAVEFHSLSKSFNMAGWRIGFVVGNSEIIKPLAKLKSYVDFGIFGGIQHAAVAALTGPQDPVAVTVETYRKRRDVFVNGLNRIGWKVDLPKATFYVWAQLPEKYRNKNSLEFTLFLLEETGIVTAPGTGFGEAGEGFVRFALVENEKRLKTAIERIKEIL